MFYVSILRSQKNTAGLYIGLTTDIEKRLGQHNRGDSTYTKAFDPWELEIRIGFKIKSIAGSFEHHLKSGSGHASFKKHFLPNGILLRRRRIRPRGESTDGRIRLWRRLRV